MTLELFDHIYIRGSSDETLVLLHGTGGTKETMAEFGRQLAPDAGLLALDGSVLEGDQRRFFKRRAFGVYDMPDLANRTRDLSTFLNAAFSLYNFDPKQAVGIGYSNGANILTNLILAGENTMTRCVLMHPLIPFMVDKLPDLADLSLLITGGEHDGRCPAPWTRKLAEGLREAGADVTLKMLQGGHEISSAETDIVNTFVTKNALVEAS